MKILPVFIIFLTTFAHLAYAAEDRPKIGLVLSGGGARGAAHIGVIEVLEEYQIPIDLIVGTSMGAVIGGLYAAGVPIETIKHDFSKLDWQDIFQHDVRRKNAYFRRKLDDEFFIAKNFIGMSEGKLHLTLGLTNGQRLYEVFKTYLLDQEPIYHFDELLIPFKAVTTDLLTGNNIPLDNGDLAQALLASMAVPGVITPVEMQGYLLVDGGVSNNLPISIAKSMGADILIVVNVSTPLYTKEEISDLTGVLGQISNILTNNNIANSEKLLTDEDILIQPILGEIATADFAQFQNAIMPGKTAAYLAQGRLKALSVPGTLYPHKNPLLSDIKLNHYRVKNDPRICPLTYGHYLRFHSAFVSEEEINEQISNLYGLNVFDSIYYEIQKENTEKYLRILPLLKPKRELMFQESLLLESDFHDNSYFSLVLGVTNPHVNSLLGEWRMVGALGSNVGFFAEYYQPLEPTLSWFVDPYFNFQRNPFNLYYQFEQIAQFMDTTYTTGVQFGRTLNNWGRLSLFAEYAYANFDLMMGLPDVPEGHNHHASVGAIFEWDLLDNLYFPHHGVKGLIRASNNHDTYAHSRYFSQVESKGLVALSSGKHSLVLGGKYNTTLSGEPGITSQYFLGGIFQLSGLYRNEVFAKNAALGSAIYFYEFSQIDFIPNRPFPLYIGASMETGNIWGNKNVEDSYSPLYANSLFVGTDTIIGPIYFAGGVTYNGHKAVHFLIGPIF